MPDETTITVATITAPKPNTRTGAQKKQGKITDTTGKNWQVWADKLNLYEQGHSYIVQQVKSFDFNGMTFQTIEKMVPVKPGQQSPAPQNPGYRSAINTPTPPSIDEYKLAERVKRRDIFVQVGMKGLDFTTMPEAEIESLVNKLTKVWHNTLGREHSNITPQKPFVPVDDMDDEIKF